MKKPCDTLDISTIHKALGNSQIEGELLMYNSDKHPDSFLHHEPFRSKHFTILFLIKGTMNVRINLNNHCLLAGNVMIIPPSAIRQLSWSGTGNHFISMLFSPVFLQQQGFIGKYFMPFDILKDGMKSCIPDTAFDLFFNLLYILEVSLTVENGSDGNSDVINNLFRATLIKLKPYFKNDQHQASTGLVYRFIDLLKAHYKQKRELFFYSSKLLVNQKYLSQLTKKKLGRTARQLVIDMVVMEAKVLLDEQVLSVKEIAGQLHFENQFHFSRFFKKYTGQAPTCYRNKISTISFDMDAVK